MSNQIGDTAQSREPVWGRVLIAGGTDWANLGKKSTPSSDPHILRSLANIKIVSIFAGCSSAHSVCIDIHGTAHVFGRNGSSALGQTGAVVSDSEPVKITPASLGAPKDAKFVHAGIGRNHTLLVASNGDCWSAGVNIMGQCGHTPCNEIKTFTKISGPWQKDKDVKVIQATAGATFSLVLTSDGKVYAMGSSEKGQLANGKTGERIVTGGKYTYDIEVFPRQIQPLHTKNIVQIASGTQHSLAMDDEGYVYAWGFAGYARLGLGDQKDQLLPQMVPQFSGSNRLTRATMIACGPTNSVVIDGQKMYYAAGKWKSTGDGSGGQPWTTFKYMQDLMGCPILAVACGGLTHFAVYADQGDVISVAGWGQGVANGELAYGDGKPKGSTKPQKIEPLIGIEVLSVAAGAWHTLFLAKPSQALSDLSRHPEVEAPEVCVICNAERDDDPLECEKCDEPYHLGCLDPPLTAVPEGEWFCSRCAAEAEGVPTEKKTVKGGKKTAPSADKGKVAAAKGAAKAASKKRK